MDHVLLVPPYEMCCLNATYFERKDVITSYANSFILLYCLGLHQFYRAFMDQKFVAKLSMVNGKPRHPQSQGSVEKAISDTKDILVSRMCDNNARDSHVGLKFTQQHINCPIVP
ncbi:hypothetical protein DPMN_172160 [Dreissena polymorpha]|uniref:Uncharacterized protein n=1 Tax=Dreissena polymorpha TaxID=45954 RepID=A0A9D4E127_DREPO|nr:hypothetical protein DPMN_172160 [Dreissena polymorpha]